MKENGISLNSASERYKDDNALVIEAVKQNGLALVSASERLKDDKALVMAAV